MSDTQKTEEIKPVATLEDGIPEMVLGEIVSTDLEQVNGGTGTVFVNISIPF